MQIKRDDKKPYYTARVKFTNSVHLRVATEKMRYFDLPGSEGKQCRFLPFDQSLSKHTPPEVNQAAASGVNPEMAQQTPGYEKLGSKQSDNLPDNSLLQCNMCVTGLDEAITSEDLHTIYERYG